MIVLEWIALLLAIGILVPIAVVVAECLVAVFLWRGRPSPWTDESHPRPKTVVLVPAQDEEELLPATLESLAPELAAQDRIVVVAHNSTDGTAETARRKGAMVVEVQDDGQGGKPAALEAGLAALDDDPPEVVVVIDADCRVEPGSIAALARTAWRHGGPVQGIYLFEPPSTDSASAGTASLSSLALLVKNQVRPLGLHRFGFPCLINGSGSAYPFQVLRRAPQGEGSIAEDYQLAIDLALAGYPTRLCPEARVTSVLPGQSSNALRQRRRWEHGHLALVLRTAPPLLWRALRKGELGIAALALEVGVPPLASLVLVWLATFALSGILAAAGRSALAFGLATSGGLLLAVGLFAAWLRFAGARRTLGALVGAPRYVAWKLPLYLGFFGRREKRWTKTPRDGVSE